MSEIRLFLLITVFTIFCLILLSFIRKFIFSKPSGRRMVRNFTIHFTETVSFAPLQNIFFPGYIRCARTPSYCVPADSGCSSSGWTQQGSLWSSALLGYLPTHRNVQSLIHVLLRASQYVRFPPDGLHSGYQESTKANKT